MACGSGPAGATAPSAADGRSAPAGAVSASWSRRATWDGDGTPDLLGARAADGTLWLYPGTGAGRFGAARQVGSGWSGRDLITSAGDWDGDGGTDLLSRETSTGRLWLDRGDGRGGFATSRADRERLGRR